MRTGKGMKARKRRANEVAAVPTVYKESITLKGKHLRRTGKVPVGGKVKLTIHGRVIEQGIQQYSEGKPRYARVEIDRTS